MLKTISRTIPRADLHFATPARASELSNRKLIGWDDLPEVVQAAINRTRNNANDWDYFAQYGDRHQVIGYEATGRSYDPSSAVTRYISIQVDPAGRVVNVDRWTSGPLPI